MDPTFGGSSRAGRESTPDVLPASQILQERLQRARSTRPKRTRQSDFGPLPGRDDDIFLEEAEDSRHETTREFDSSPSVPAPRSELGASGSNGRRRGLGAKDLDGHMDRLTKQNFALKLELDHRRAHTAKLQEQIDDMREQVEWAEQMKDEHAELLRINSQLVEELEKRDRAIEEAMDIICDLEDRVADAEERNSNTRPSTANADSGYAGTETHEQVPPSSPPEPGRASKTPHINQRMPPPAASAAAFKLTKVVNGQTPARPKRKPMILSQKKPSTHALRTVYLETVQSLHPVQSFNSLLTKHDTKADDDEPILDSPRLSVLSESSFPSIYSPKDKASPERYAWEAEDTGPMASARSPPLHLRQDSIKRVSQWMDERDLPQQTPSKSNRISPSVVQQAAGEVSSSPSKQRVDDAQYQSIAKALSDGWTTAAQPSNELTRGVSYIKPYPIRLEKKASVRQPKPTSFAGPMFGEPLLPPTPDSVSTRMLRESRSSLDGDKSLLDTTPAAVRGYDALEPEVRTAPKQIRSTSELNYAYHKYLERRHEDHGREVDDVDVSEETVRDLSLDYDGFPDGASIIMGTPSRFLKHAKPPADILFDSSEVPSVHPGRSPLKRRQTSGGPVIGTAKPSFSRAETSPNTIPKLETSFTAAPTSSNGSITSPRSFHSGSSSNRTILQVEERNRAITPEVLLTEPHEASPRSRTSISPARTFSQRTRTLLRRMSNTPKDNRSEREKSPLPTLTTTPSTAYFNDVPKDARRPGTSHAGESSAQVTPRPPSSTEGRRPSIPGRSVTAPTSPPRSSSASGGELERKNFFKRHNSVQKSTDTPPPSTIAVAQEGSAGRGGIARRRGSIRDAVGSAARRPWR